MRHARVSMIVLGMMLGLTLAAFGLYIGYVSRLWYEASANW